MNGPVVAIFHQPPRDSDGPLSRMLAEARGVLIAEQAEQLLEAGATRILVLPGREDDTAETFGERLARLVREERITHGLIVFGSGALPLLRQSDAAALVGVAATADRAAITNNRYSSDICGLSQARALLDLPPLPSDNALPRWLEERAGFTVRELPGRDRLALDLDTPLDLALVAGVRGAPRSLRAFAASIEIPRREELRALAADPRRELLVFGRAGSRTLRWLEWNVRCRVRFLAEERGLRASSPLAIGGSTGVGRPRAPSSTLTLLLAEGGPTELGQVIAGLADGAIVDSRVLMAGAFGIDEDAWPSPEDRFASDLQRPEAIEDAWLRELTLSAGSAGIPILLGAHTLLGPGIPVLLRGAAQVSRR